jgi:hypothetical protein
MRCDAGQVILIDTLPDDVLLAIFDFCADEDQNSKKGIEAWQSLVHVCQRWRGVVFGSPRRLNLRLVATNRTPVRDTLDSWPPVPLVIQDNARLTESVDNIVTVLERRDRVDTIRLLDIDGPPLEKVLAAMQEPFSELTHLLLVSHDETVPVVPDSFLGRSAPRLGFFWLDHIPFPGLPNLLLSAVHLSFILLWNIPHSGYFSPEAMVTALSTLTSLEFLRLEFQSPLSHPDRENRRPPPPTRSVLPVLKVFLFKGVCEYLEDLVARIDAPQINYLGITFFNQILFDTPQSIQFISRTPTLRALETARVAFLDDAAMVYFSSQTSDYRFKVEISCRKLDWQVSALEQVCTSCLPSLSTPDLEDLYIFRASHSDPARQDNIENTLWLELLLPFTAVKNLYLCKEFAPRIVLALKESIEGRTTAIFPTLQNIFLEGLQPSGHSGPFQEGIGKFVAARQLSGHPLTVSLWERDPERDWD